MVLFQKYHFSTSIGKKPKWYPTLELNKRKEIRRILLPLYLSTFLNEELWGNEDKVFLWGNVGCCSSPPLSAVAQQLQSWHQSPAGRYAILLCKQLKAAPLHSKLLIRVAVWRINPICLHINPRDTPMNGIPENCVCWTEGNKRQCRATCCKDCCLAGYLWTWLLRCHF